MSTLYDFNPITPAQITREENSNLGSGIVELGIRGELGDAKQGFKGGLDFEVWTLAVAGVQLDEGLDYDLKNIDDFYSASGQANYDVYTGLQITNVIYQSVPLYITRKVVLSYIEASTINDIVDQVDFTGGFVGKEIKEFSVYTPISPTFPWLCLSLSSRALTTTNYTTEFIDELRSRKITYDELDTAQTEFTGSWAALVFTLDNNASNVALITALSKDYLYAGTFTDFRILSDGTNEYEIVGLDAVARTITVDNTGTPAGTEIEIYLNRIFGSTSAQHHTQAGLAVYQTGGDMLTEMRRPDQMQQITGDLNALYNRSGGTGSGAFSGSTLSSGLATIGANTANRTIAGNFDSANSTDARTGSETIAKSTTSFRCLFVGEYTP